MEYGLSLTEKLLQQAPLDTRIPPNSWDVGRLVLDQNYRHGQCVLKKCLFLSLIALLEKKDAKVLFSSCSYIFSRVYKRFGFSTLASGVPLKNTGKTYSLIKGEVDTVLSMLNPMHHS